MARDEPMRMVKFQVSIAGDGHAYQINEEHELVEWLAIAYCEEPVGDPRAIPVGWDLEEVKAERRKRRGRGERAVDEQRETHEGGGEVIPPDAGEEPTVDDSADGDDEPVPGADGWVDETEEDD